MDSQAEQAIRIEVAEKLVPLIVKPKRLKIGVGGRAGTKSIGFGDAFLKFCSDGEQLCCAREFQNSIDDSVHALLKGRIRALDAPGFNVMANRIEHASGGQIIYKGLARNPDSIRSLFGTKRTWIEEGQSLSEESLEVLIPTIREADSEIWISMNRGSSKDAIARLVLSRYEAELKRRGYYEDDDILIVEINWRDNPWFAGSVLDRQRRKDFETMPRAKYDHIWEGAYGDTVEDAIIDPAWFDACIDAHKKLGFEPLGVEVVAHDPADSGDAKTLAYRHGSVILEALEKTDGDVNDACDWATDYAADVKADEFVWDIDGMGMSLKRQIATALAGKKITLTGFSGASGVSEPDKQYEAVDGESKSKSNKETFQNKRAQRYMQLRDRIYRTYLAVTKGRRLVQPDDLISFSSKIKCLQGLRSELCRIPRKSNGAGRIAIMSKPEMRSAGIDSPNLSDAVMMTLEGGRVKAVSMQQQDYSVPTAHSAFARHGMRG